MPAIGQTTPRSRTRYRWWFSAVSLIILLGYLLWQFWRATSSIAPQQASQPVHRQITFIGDASYPAISPDGSFVAYVKGERGSNEQLKVIVQDLAGGQPIEIFKNRKSSPVLSLRWSPDGSKLALTGTHESGPWGIYIIPRLGGEFRFFSTSVDYICWSPDGTQIAGIAQETPKKLYILDVATSEFKSIDINGPHDWTVDIDWSRNRNCLLFRTIASGKNSIWTIKPDGSNQNEAFSTNRGIISARWSPDGKAIYYLLRTEQPELWKIFPSAEAGKPLRAPIRLLSGIEIGPYFTVSQQNGRLLCTRQTNYNNLWLATPSSPGIAGQMIAKPITAGTSVYIDAQISPDGKQIVLCKYDPETGSANLFVMPVEANSQRQITFSKLDARSPAWSPDSAEIAFSRQDEHGVKAWKVKSAGGMAEEFANSDVSSDGRYVTWSPGPRIMYQRPGNRNFHIIDPISKSEEPLIKDYSAGWMFNACSSPDGSKVAVFWNRAPSPGLWVISLTDFSGTLLLKGRLFPFNWTKDQKWIYAATDSMPQKILMIQAPGGQSKILWTLPDHASVASMTSDGQRIIYSVFESKSDVWLVENFDTDRN